MIVTLVHELRRRGGGIGVASMCAGGGMGSATVIEVMPGLSAPVSEAARRLRGPGPPTRRGRRVGRAPSPSRAAP